MRAALYVGLSLTAKRSEGVGGFITFSGTASVCHSQGSCSGTRSRHEDRADASASADAGELLPQHELDDAGAAYTSPHDHQGLVVRHHLADDLGVMAMPMAVHSFQNVLRVFPADDGDELALVGEVERVNPQDLAGPLHILADGDALFVEDDPHLRASGNRIEPGRHAAPRGI